ncbi:MAG: Uma2 family endonuclease [Crocosphaera sp.]|nr:Uma2 family endonuclease [Crocosphaera sp.]
MIMQTEKQQIYTPQEYLDLEIVAKDRHEYRNGEIIVMSGGTPNHNRIILNFGSVLNFAFKGQPYDVFVTDQRLWVPSTKTYTYPDIMIVQGEIQLQEGRNDTIINPLLIAEVLSQSTEAYDRGDKFTAYRTLPSLQEYILIEQYRPHIEQFSKTESGQWLLSDYDGQEATLTLKSVSLEIPLLDIYDKVNFQNKGTLSMDNG